MFFRKITMRDEKRRRTRVIYGGNVNHLVSPVVPLLKTIASAAGQIVPERKDELAHLISNGVAIEVDAAREDFYIAANVAEKRVILGLAALERIWAYTYFYLAILDEERKHGKGVEIDLTSIAEIQPARGLAIWALDCEKKKSQSPWPDELPRPDRDDGSDDHIGKTNPYFYHVVCFMILHEIGHITLGHHPNKFEDKKTSYDCEFAADEWAAKFMLEKWDQAGRGEKDYIGRCTGIALGIAMLVGIELYHHAAKDDHPSVADRLLNFFTKFSPESGGSVATKTEFPMYLATVIIQGQFLNAGVKFEYLKPFEDFTDYLIEAHRAMSEHKINR